MIKKFEDWLFEAEIRELTGDYVGSTQRRPIEFNSWDRRRKTFNFTAEGKSPYELKLRVDDYSKVSRLKGTVKEKLDLALGGDISLFCSCPSFRYNGYMYMADQLAYGIKSQQLFPEIRNPQLQGTVCKHLYQLMETIEDFTPQMEREVEDTLRREREARR
jgi:hypothetical protein